MSASDLEKSIDELANNFAEGLYGLVTGTWLKEGVLRQGVVSVIWSIYHEMPEQREALAEILEDWPLTIQGAIREDRAKRSAEGEGSAAQPGDG